MARLLVVEDDPVLCPLIAKYLKQTGYVVEMARTGEEMRVKMAKAEFDLIVLDLMLPDADGLEIVRSLRAKSDIGIVIISGLGEEIDRVAGLEVGGDDYVPKPFSNRELLARVRSVLRRRAAPPSVSHEAGSSVARFDGWTLNFRTRELTSPEGERVQITVTEFDLLTALFKEGVGVTCSREMLHEAVFKRPWTEKDRGSLDNIVSRLRKKIETDPDHPAIIKTVRGAGYVLAADVRNS